MSTASLPGGDPDPPRAPGLEVRPLTSWKDIAAYLGTTVRTAQRWERERDLPVRRLPGPRGQVFAEIAELDRWRRATPQEFPLPAEHELAPAPAEPAPAEPAVKRGMVRRWWVAAVLVLLGSAAFWVAASFSPSGSNARMPSAVRVHDSGFTVFDRYGAELWHREFPDTRLASTAYSAYGKSLTLVQDLDGDGRREILFGLQPHRGQGTLICYAADGSERWRYTPGANVRTRTGTFTAPFSVRNVVVGRATASSEPLILTLGNHHAFFPAEAVLLAANGQVRGRYWHSGHLHSANFWDVNGDGVNEIVLGGVSNAYRAATIVSLDVHRFNGASNEREKSDYQLLGFPVAAERERIIFPRTKLGKASYALGNVLDVEVENNQLLVHVAELYRGDAPMPLMWTLDQRLRFRDVSASSGLTLAYEQLRRDNPGSEDLKAAVESLPEQLLYLSGKQ